jgi:16S rRNA (cytosine967-C5)-methyltransferase
MHYIRQHIAAIVDTYKGDLPLAPFLKGYFRQYPKLGSRDRKILSAMAYSFYRCAKALDKPGISFDERIDAALFLCYEGQAFLTRFIKPEWQDAAAQEPEKRITALAQSGILFDLDQLFPGPVSLSEGISRNQWLQSMLVQPHLFLHVRSRNMQQVQVKLKAAGIAFTECADNCLQLPNGAAINEILRPGDYRVQDASSQSTAAFFHTTAGQHWWDCCSGAGGKSLLLKDTCAAVQLTVSDVRASILHNLAERFRLYGYPIPESLQLSAGDAAAIDKVLGRRQFDALLCDVPCSGSGTWARTPEQLFFFDPAKINTYASLQASIALNAARYLKPGGYMYYITCSVFHAENEGVVAQLLAQRPLELERMQLINGIDKGADCMFIAVLKKTSTEG